MSNYQLTSYTNTPYSKMEYPLALTLPLANSTPTDGPTANTTIYINNLNYNKVTINETSLKCQKSTAKKVLPKKAITAKKTTTNAIKPAGNNSKKMATVQRILNQINMAKYAHLFKNYDIDRFKELRELDLNAMGITRPQELRTLKEAIQRAKVENY